MPESKPKVLVVDDEPNNLELLDRILHSEYRVLKAQSGQEALEILAREADIAAIVSDQRMPLMTGTEFLSVAAAQYPDVMRIMLTAYTDVEDLVEAINSGKVFKYVTKPWQVDEIQTVVRQAVETHQVLASRTEQLRRTLRQESLLNAVLNTIRSRPDHRQILQTIVETLGHMFEVSCCILRPVRGDRMDEEAFVFTGRGLEFKVEELARTVWATEDVLAIDDVTADDRLWGDPDRVWAYQRADIRSTLIVPLIAMGGDRPGEFALLAVLALHQCGQCRSWRDDEVQLAIMVAEQAALTLSQARTYERMRALARREALVNQIATAIRSTLEPQEIFSAITRELGQALKTDGCALSLWTEEDEFVQCVGLYDATQDTGDRQKEPVQTSSPTPHTSPLTPHTSTMPQSVVPISGNPVLLQTIATKEPVAVDDLQQHPELNLWEMPLRSPARALLVVPLLTDGNIIGSISLRQNERSRVWKTDEIELAKAVASQAAIAVQQSRLYQTTRAQAERLLELDRQKTEFFQNVSHEFRTPLTLIVGPLDHAIANHQGLPYEQATIVLRNARRLLRLVNQLLDIQRLDAGKMQPTFRPCDLVTFVAQTVESFRPYCEKKGLHLQTQLQSCPKLYLDIEKFDKAVYNLLSNAMKFTDPGGTIVVAVESAGEYCLLQISDTGIGIRADQIPYLFDRFHQAEGSASRSYEGSGLGLALVKELVELHGGQISVESDAGRGSTFSVWLPVGNAHLPPDRVVEVQAELKPSRASIELADVEEIDEETAVISKDDRDLNLTDADTPLTILVVDDNADLRLYASKILKEQGYRVILARNGAEGFQVAKERCPDLIVTDLMMPLVSGLDMVASIRKEETLKGTPIVMLTAKANEETRLEGIEHGADAYLSKPFSDRELIAEVRNLLALKETERRISQLNNYLTQSVLRRFLPPAMVTKAASGELELDLEPEPRLITILFSDIVGFTQLANTLRSRRVAEVLNEYLAEMTEAVFAHGGTVDKFVGDAVMAIFGAPEEMKPHQQVKQAVAAARQMHDRLDRLNQKWQERGLDRVQFRCGIHQGTAVVGMFGSAERADYTAIGPSVNIAARLQEAADPNAILVSAAVADYLDDEEITKFRPLKLKGIDETVLTFVVDRGSLHSGY